MTLLEVLQSTTAYFEKRKIESARLNAEHLLAHALRRKRLDLYLEFERPLHEAELAPLREFVRRRGEGEPLQHLLGTVEFCGLEFLCDKRAMVPRPETEELVEFLKAEIRDSKCEIADVGTGSGVIALSLATKFPESKVFATDVSEDALQLARENAERLHLGQRVEFSKRHLLEGLDERFDLVVANLPYISMQERNSLPREVLRDPEAALFGGDRGDELIQELIEQAPARLGPNGLLALEIGLGQSDALLGVLQEKKFHDIEAKNDYSGTPRFLFARYG